jgi:hypothetical protein
MYVVLWVKRVYVCSGFRIHHPEGLRIGNNVSINSSSSGKLHSNSPPSSEWRKFAIGDYWHYVNGEWSGIIIHTVSQLWVSWDKWIHLKHPTYHMTFCPNADTNNTFWHLIDMPTLREAKKLAEEYYKQWLSVNQNFDTHTKNLYPLVETLGGRASGNISTEGDAGYGL